MSEGVILKEEYFESGQIPSYTGPTPTKPETVDYVYTFTGWDKELKEITEDTVYTAVFEEVEKEYGATINLINENDVVIFWDKEDYNEVVFNVGFNNPTSDDLSYRIILTDELNNTYEYEGIDATATINVPKDVLKLTITYQLIGKFNGLEKVYDEVIIDNQIILNNPTITFNDALTLSGVDEYELEYIINTDYEDLEEYNVISFDITYSDNTNEVISINDFKVNEANSLNIKVPSFVNSISIEYTLEFKGNNGLNPRVLVGTHTYELTNEYSLNRQLVSNIDSTYVIFEFNYHFINEDTTIALKDLATNEVVVMDIGSNQIFAYSDTAETTKEYSYYLSTLDGTSISSEQTITIDCSEVTGEYNLDYVNPGDAVVTYNDDNTINIYLGAKFETSDPDICYAVLYTNYDTGESKEISYTTSGAIYENAPRSSYGIVYYVYKNVNGVLHILEEIYVSGGIEFTNYLSLEGTVTSDDNINYTISYQIYDYIYQFDDTSFELVIDDVVYTVDSTNITHDEENSCYVFTYVIDFEPTNISASFEGSPSANNYDLISEIINIKGNKYTRIEINFL